MCRFRVYREAGIFYERLFSTEGLHVNSQNMATVAGERVDVVVSEPKLTIHRPETVLVVGPTTEEVDRTVKTSLEDLRRIEWETDKCNVY